LGVSECLPTRDLVSRPGSAPYVPAHAPAIQGPLQWLPHPALGHYAVDQRAGTLHHRAHAARAPATAPASRTTAETARPRHTRSPLGHARPARAPVLAQRQALQPHLVGSESTSVP